MSKEIIKNELNKYLSEATIGGSEESMTYAANTNDQNAVKVATDQAKTDGVDSTVELRTEDDRDENELNGLDFDERDSDAIEYGIQNEAFDELMEDLKESGSPTIKLAESVNPRIKVKDLIKHLKNK